MIRSYSQSFSQEKEDLNKKCFHSELERFDLEYWIASTSNTTLEITTQRSWEVFPGNVEIPQGKIWISHGIFQTRGSDPFCFYFLLPFHRRRTIFWQYYERGGTILFTPFEGGSTFLLGKFRRLVIFYICPKLCQICLLVFYLMVHTLPGGW